MFSYRVFKNAMLSLIRNKWLTFATVTVMTLTLFTVSIFVMLNILINSSIETVKSRIDIEVYFKTTVSEEDILDIQKDLKNMSVVKEVKYISKEDALGIFKERFRDDSELTETISGSSNPLPASLVINANKTNDLDGINGFFRGGKYNELVDSTSYEKNKDTVKKLVTFGDYINKGGFILIAIFIFTSLIVVLNTIKMTIFTRKEEIEIMRLVGATNWYIRWPFILEGAFYGLISMIFASTLIILALSFGREGLIAYFADFGNNFYDSINTYGLIMLAWQFCVSIFVGVVSATIAIGRYLKV